MTDHIDYLEAIDQKQRLIDKLNLGLFANEEWVSLIVLLAMTGWIAMADDLDQRRKHYAKLWCDIS